MRAAIGLWLLLLCAGTAVAKPRVAVVGDDAAVVAAVEKALASKVERVDPSADDLTATVRVTVTGKKARKATATVVVLQGKDDAQVGKLVIKEKKGKLAAAVGKVVWKRLGKSITRARSRKAVSEPVVAAEPAPPPPPTRAAERDPAPAAALVADPDPIAPSEPVAGESRGGRETSSTSDLHATVSPRSHRTTTRFTITVDERPFWRRLRWNDDLDQVLRRYDLAANAVGVTVAVRPFRAVPGAFLQLGGELAVGVNGSRTDDGMDYQTSASEWSATAGWGRAIQRVDVALTAAYGEHRFSIDGDQGMGGELLPDVNYRWARGGLDTRWPLAARWALSARGGYRHLLGTGDLQNGAWFPRATGQGVDGSVGIHLRVAGWLGAYARAEVRHYFFTLNPEVGDELVAGGAVDSFLGGAIGFAVAVP